MIGVALAAAVAAQAQSLPRGQSLPQGPIDYAAEEMTMEPRDRRVLLDGKVRLSRADLLVTGDHAVADLAPEQKAQKSPLPQPGPQKRGKAKRTPEASRLGLGQGIQRFTLDGAVHVARGTRTADGAHGVLDSPAQTLLLTGTPEAPPILRDGSETLTGERVLIHLDSEDVEVTKPRLVLRRSLPEDGAKESAKKPTPVRVEAQNLTLDHEKQLAHFTSDVVVHRGDAVVRSPRMDARYDKTGQLTKLELRGGVDLRQGDRRATGKSADYDARTREVVLTGDPKLYDRGDVLQGERIDLALDSKEVRVEKAHGRLRPENHQDEVKE